MKAGIYHRGIQNEFFYLNKIEKHLETKKSLNLIITDNKYELSYEICEILSVQRDTSNRKKSDINMVDINGNIIPISIKKDSAEMWESADSYWAENAKLIIEDNKSLLSYENGVYRVVPNLAVIATQEEKRDVIFGSDILNRGMVLVKTFRNSDFQYDEKTNTLIVTVSKIVLESDDLDDIYFLIRNDRSRKSSKILPGIRVVAVSNTRITSNVKVVGRDVIFADLLIYRMEIICKRMYTLDILKTQYFTVYRLMRN